METLYRRPINIQAFLLHLIYTKEVKLSCGIAHNIMHRVFWFRGALRLEKTFTYLFDQLKLDVFRAIIEYQ